MHQHIRRARRFFWWCAAADATILDAPDTPRLDGIKYAAVGALVCLTTTVAACGWTHNAMTMVEDERFRIPIAIGLGLLMGAIVFCMERVLVVSIRQDALLSHKLAAFAWRGLIASLAAALVTTPFALAYFNNGILAHLDDEKLALMAAKRQAVEGLFALKDRAGVVAAIDRDLAENRKRREQLPADVQSLSEAAASCESEHAALQQLLGKKIAAANRRYAAMLRQINQYPEATYLRHRLGAISQEISGWKNALAAKVRACREMAEQFASAREEYLSRLDRQRQQQMARKQEAERSLDESQSKAGAMLAQADAVVTRVTAPDLSARIRALGQMTAQDRLVLIVLATTYAFFFLIDIMPVLAKLVMRTIYDRRISGEYRRVAAEIEAETALAEADAAMRAEIAKAELLGLKTLLCQTGSDAMADLARLRMELEKQKAEVAAPFAPVSAMVDTFHRTQAQADDIAERYAGRPDLFRHIEAVRESLATAMASAAAAVKSQSPAAPTA
jgi:hypothetical protein